MKLTTKTSKTLYRYSGLMYGFIPCILAVDGTRVVKYRPYWFILWPLVWLGELIHLICCQLSSTDIREELPKKPFYNIKELNRHISR